MTLSGRWLADELPVPLTVGPCWHLPPTKSCTWGEEPHCHCLSSPLKIEWCFLVLSWGREAQTSMAGRRDTGEESSVLVGNLGYTCLHCRHLEGVFMGVGLHSETKERVGVKVLVREHGG